MDQDLRELYAEIARLTKEIRANNDRVSEALRYYKEQETWSDVALAVWISSTDTERPFSPTHVTDSSTGFIAELQRTGQASTTIGTQARASDPYSTELLPVSDLSPIYAAERSKLTRIFACAFDTTRDPAGTGQDALTIAEIVASLGTTRAYMQTGYLNGQIAFFQPNFFRPMIFVDKTPIIYGNLQRSEITQAHAGHLSIGIPNPWFSEVNVNIGKINKDTLHAYAQMEQYISGVAKFQRYTCYIAAEFLLGGTVK